MPEAEARAARYIELWGFKNTYAIGKHLAEKAVTGLAAKHGLPLVILRPSLVSAVAAEPYPGYAGNFAGQVGGAAAYLVGLYNDQPEAAASNGLSVWDVVPGDIVAHAVVAAAAAGAAPAARDFVTTTRAAPACLAVQQRQQQQQQEQAQEQQQQQQQAPMIVQVSSSCVYPLPFSHMFNAGMTWCAAHRRPFTLAWGRARAMSPGKQFNARAVAAAMRITTLKVSLLVWLLRRVGGRIGGRAMLRAAKIMEAGLKTFETINEPKYDLQLFFSAGALQRLEECLAPEERDDFRIVWRSPHAPLAGAEGAAAAKRVVVVSASASTSDGEEDGSGSGADADAAAALTAMLRAAAGGNSSGDGGAPALKAPVPPAALAPREFFAKAPGYGLAADQLIAPGDSVEVRRRKIAAAVAASRAGGWQLFMHNMVAYLWRTIYGRDVPAAVQLPAAKVAALLPHLTPEEAARAADVRHTFSAAVERAAA